MRNLTNPQWTSLYNTQYVPNAGDLVLVADSFWFDISTPPAGKNWMVSSNFSAVDFSSTQIVRHFNGTLTSVTSHGLLQVDRNGTFAMTYDQAQYHMLFDLATSPRSFKRYASFRDNATNPYDFDLSVTFNVFAANATSYLPSVSFAENDDDEGMWMLKPNVLISYGLSQPMNDGTQIQISRAFILVVICCNIVKIAVIYSTILLTSSTSFRPFITGGDAIASYLESPDPLTTNMCLFTREKPTESIAKGDIPSSIKWNFKVHVLGNAAAGDGKSLAMMYMTMYSPLSLATFIH